MLIRPGALVLSALPGGNGVRATIRSTSFLGGVQRHHVEAGGLRLIVDQPLRGAEEIRSQMWLAVDPSGIHLLPAEAS